MTRDQNLLRSIAVWVGIAVGSTWLQWHLRNRWRARAVRNFEASYEGTYDAAASDLELSAYVTQLQGVLSGKTLSEPELGEVPRWSGGPKHVCGEALKLAASRFAIALPHHEIAVTPHLPAGIDVALWESDDADHDDEGLLSNDPAVRFRFREGLHAQPLRLAYLTAREVASLVLRQNGSQPRVEDRSRFLDTACVLAGYGPLMEELAYKQSVQKLESGEEQVSWRSSTALHRTAIRGLIARRRSLSRP